jgi:hypothetical protein
MLSSFPVTLIHSDVSHRIVITRSTIFWTDTPSILVKISEFSEDLVASIFRVGKVTEASNKPIVSKVKIALKTKFTYVTYSTRSQ